MKIKKNKPIYVKLTPMKLKHGYDGDMDMFTFEYVEDGNGSIYKMEISDEITE